MDKLTLTTIKVRKSTLTNLRHIRAYADESMVDILDRLVKQELERYQEREQNSSQMPAMREGI